MSSETKTVLALLGKIDKWIQTKSYPYVLRKCCHWDYDQDQVHLVPSETAASYYKSKVSTIVKMLSLHHGGSNYTLYQPLKVDNTIKGDENKYGDSK